MLAYNVYQLAKNQAHLGILLDEWERLGIRLAFANEELEDTPIGRLILNARTFAAEIEGERRKDRIQRARLARVESGKPAGVGSRANYGYVWAQTRRPDGRLTHDRLEVNPTTAAIMVRMYEKVDTGMTLRGIAATPTSEGVPTPTGKAVARDPSTVLKLLLNPIYKGQAVTLRHRAVPVEKAVRHLYVHRSRVVVRPAEEQVPLPPEFAPALVSAELWDRVAAQLRRNRELSAGNNRAPTASILRGLVRCGHCGYRTTILNTTHNGVVFRCQIGIGRPGRQERCRGRGTAIMAHKLDAAVWAKVASVLRHPAVITDAVERMRAAPPPGAENLASIDSRLAEIDRQIAAIHRQVLKVDDEDARERWGGDEKLLWNERRQVEAERVQATRDVDGWRLLRYDMEAIVAEIAEGTKDPGEYTSEERRKTLLTFGVEAVIYRADHAPRARMVLRLPLARALALDLRLDGDEQGAANAGLDGAFYVDNIKDLVTV